MADLNCKCPCSNTRSDGLILDRLFFACLFCIGPIGTDIWLIFITCDKMLSWLETERVWKIYDGQYGILLLVGMV